MNPFAFTQPKNVDAALAALAAPGARPIAGGTNLLDIHDIEVIFADEEDRIVSKQLGATGVGEIGIVGVAAAVANAHHAGQGPAGRSRGAREKVNFHPEYDSSHRQHWPIGKLTKTHLSLALPDDPTLFFPFAAQPQRVCPA
jgi:hypothetical protein